MPRKRRNRSRAERARRKRERLENASDASETTSSPPAGRNALDRKSDAQKNGPENGADLGGQDDRARTAIMVDRGSDGRFVAGNQAAVGHGRPPKLSPDDYAEALQQALPPAELGRIVKAAIKDATGDDAKTKADARKFLTQLLKPAKLAIATDDTPPPVRSPKSKHQHVHFHGDHDHSSKRFRSPKEVWAQMLRDGVLDQVATGDNK